MLLTDAICSYYRSDVDSEPAGQIAIETMVSVAANLAESKKDAVFAHCFDVVTLGGRSYALCAETKGDLDTWLDLLKSNMDALPAESRAISVAACSHTGYLHKRGEVNTAFRRRFFGLHGRDLYYFKSREVWNPQ